MAKKTVKRKTKTKAKAKAKKTGLGYRGYAGKKTKLSVSAFWTKMFAVQTKAMLTDTQICSAMFAEFPDAKRRTPADVMIFRNRFNNGNLADQDNIPKVKCAEYLPCTHCHKGVRKPRWGEKVKPPVKKVTKKVTKKKVSRKTTASVNSGKDTKNKE